jgi:hypothetical protein
MLPGGNNCEAAENPVSVVAVSEILITEIRGGLAPPLAIVISPQRHSAATAQPNGSISRKGAEAAKHCHFERREKSLSRPEGETL